MGLFWLHILDNSRIESDRVKHRSKRLRPVDRELICLPYSYLLIFCNLSGLERPFTHILFLNVRR
jgi:hypothetical protein